MENRLVVLFGSQTFTAQEIAERAWRRSKALGFTGPIMALDEYPIQNLIREHFVLFVCATTGQGDEPDNMKNFWRFLRRKNLPSTSLMRLNYGVLALGDSSYAKYNFVGKKLNNRLQQLGAMPMLDIGLCDYQHDLGHDAVVGPWLEKFWQQLKCFFPNINLSKSEENKFIPRWKVSLLKESNDDLHLHRETDGVNDEKDRLSKVNDGLSKDIYFGDGHKNQFIEPKELKVVLNSRTTTEDHFQDVRLITFKMADDSPFDYKPGDILNLRPRNSKESIKQLFAIFETHDIDIKPHYRLSVEQCHADMPIPQFLKDAPTVYEIAEQYWDLNFVPTSYVFSLLSIVSDHKLEREKCMEFCSPGGQEDLLNYCRRPRRTILEVLQDFHRSTSRLTVDIIFELFSPIKPRSFSIASSAKKDSATVELLVAVVNYYSTLKKERKGLCSNWLKSLNEGDRIFGWFKAGSLIFPQDVNTPCILIGPGTGLAPFRSYLLEREASRSAASDVLWLLFGCRYEKKDFHCGGDLERLRDEGKITLVCAFSRDGENKVYVQHKIAEHSDALWKLIKDKSGMIYISGSSKNMPDNVKLAFVEEVFMKSGGLDKGESEKMLQDMEKNNRLQLETW